MSIRRKYCAGDWVEVKTKEEILKTLDKSGQLEGMPFMPEMFDFCGKKFRVHKRAHKTCDTVFPIRSRRVPNAIHLETRCNGQSHGGCQAACLIFWKDAWLKPIEEVRESALPEAADIEPKGADCTEEDVFQATRANSDKNEADPVFVCQATRLPYFTEELSPYDVRQYIEDLRSGNVGLGRWLRGALYITYQRLIKLGIGLGRPLRWLYDRFQRAWGGLPYPRWWGQIPEGQTTPAINLGLFEGDWVRVKSYEQILATCTTDNMNRGMRFDGEMVPYCGRVFRVHKRVTQIINENTGKMMKMKTPCIILENVVCQARYSECRMFCPREIYPYWREIWLERTEAPANVSDHDRKSLAGGAT